MDGAFLRFREGDGEAVVEAVRAYSPIGYAAAFGVLRDPGGSEAITAEVLAQGLIGEVAVTGEDSAERAWVAAEARRRALTTTRTRPKRGRFGRRQEEAPVIPEAHTMLDLIDPTEARRALTELSFGEQEVLSLSTGSGLDADEIGVRLAITTTEARDLIREALLNLEDALLGTEHGR
ncbi:MAG: hypothetical protein R3B97_09355 [Dehalococcoidia bacterium]|nr:hypothetical protein [Dehalococcoidia bacterium]MCB9484735.1 hypothetical protein [Thermoflexaceae bacterium]